MGKYPHILLHTCIWLLLSCLPISAFGADKVKLQLIWKNQFQFAGYHVAKELGFYDEAGLDVTIKEYEFGQDVTADVVSQTADFGVGRSSLILENMEGQPIFLLSAIFQHSPFVLMAKDREDLKTIADLKGKRIMVTDDAVGIASLTAMLAANGIKSDDYTAQKHTFSVDDLINGNTDAVAAYISNEPYHMQKRGEPHTIIRSSPPKTTVSNFTVTSCSHHKNSIRTTLNWWSSFIGPVCAGGNMLLPMSMKPSRSY